jgi:hypothetical protein
MNNIGFGIFCFGEDYYYKGTDDKVKNILDNVSCDIFILTDTPKYFQKKYSSSFVKIVPYYREYKSYHDKLILTKVILKEKDICILLDADLHITDYSFLKELINYNFKTGISYIETLENHPSKKKLVSEIDMDQLEWNNFKLYAQRLYPHFGNMLTIWEYILIINKVGFKEKRFFDYYEKLQLAKEFCDITSAKDVKAAGEGVSIAISAHLSNTDIQLDSEIYNIVKNKMVSVSKRFTRPEFWPDWMK